MKDLAVKWIYDNAKEIKTVVFGFLMLNLVVVALAIVSGQFLQLLLVSIRIVLTEILLVVPAVMLYKEFK